MYIYIIYHTYTILYYTILYYTIQYNTIPYYTILSSIGHSTATDASAAPRKRICLMKCMPIRRYICNVM